jgi:general secretion pathway protein J
MKRMSAHSGFTLVEVMIAVAILAIVSSLIFGSFSRVFEARDLVEKVQERYHNVRVALERLSREISMALIYDCRELDTPMGERRFQTLFKVESMGKIDRLVMTTFSHLRMVRDANESDMNVLSYYGEDDPDDPAKTNLMRREKLRIDDEPEEEEGTEMILCHDIESLQYELWDDTKQDWVDEWDCSQIERQNQMPRLVRISLVVKDEYGEEIPFTTTARIFANKPLSNWIKPST